MKTASAMYKIMRAVDTSWYEWRILQGANTYELDKLKSLNVIFSLTTNSGIDIGNANSAECHMTLLEESANWQRMAAFTVQFRIRMGSTLSEWITLGKFYTDERSEDKDGNLSIVAFDAMLKLEQTWADKIPEQLLPASYPITARAWATMIQSASLAAFADLTQLDDTVSFIGLNTTATIRDVLKSIAAVHAGNWMMTTSETLNLMQFVNTPDVDFPTTLDLKLDTQQFEDSPALDAVTGVHLETEMGTVMESGDASGYMVKAVCDVSSTTGVSELCLSNIEDYVFRPFSAGTAYLDPLADLGDPLKIDDTIYQIMSINWTLGKTPTADVSAPYDKEIDHEYTVPNQNTKTYRKAMSLVDEKMDDYVPWDEFATAIEQNEQAVVIAASHTYVTQHVYNAQIAEIQSQIDGSIQTWSGNAVPTLNNSPAVDWISPTDKASHVGDTYFVNSDAGIPEAGNYYRFEVNNGVYSWQLLTDSALTEALAQAAAALAAAEDAQDTASASLTEAQTKGRVFVVQPTPPYDVGDLWFNDTNSVIKVCMQARTSAESYVASDWVKRDKYIDEIDLETYLADSELIQSIQNQLDKKAETFYQSADPAIDWGVHPAGIAIAGLDVAGISGTIAAQHTGDLWYKTTDNTTWYFNGSTWEQQDVPAEVFDKIDGKAQVFIIEPYAPYNVGDLWFNSATADIKTCIRARTTPGFAENDWEKRNKYTDDTATDLLREQVTAEFEVQSDAISAKVSRTGGTNSTFGWTLTDSSHAWYSGNQAVMSISYRDGLVVKGNITATSGYIGNSSQGFEITSTAMRNGMTSLTDTSHNGIYLGTDGIALGQGKFKVTSAGAITATSGTIGGLTLSNSAMYTNGQSSYSGTGDGIYIGSNGFRIGSKFKVSTSGDVTMNNLTANDLLANNAVLKGTLKIYNNSGTSYNTIGSGDLYTGAYQSANNYSNWNGTYSTVNSNGSNWTSAYNSACVSGGYSYDGASHGYSYKGATNYNTADYPTYFTCGTLFAKSGISANGNILCSNYDVYCDELRATGGIQVAYGGNYYTASWKSTSGSMNYTHAYKVYDINGAEHWTGDLGSPAVNVSPEWVLGLAN